MADNNRNWFDSIKKLPGWIMGLIAFVTAVVGFVKLWQGDTGLVTVVLLAIGVGGGTLGCAYLAFKRTPPLVEGGKPGSELAYAVSEANAADAYLQIRGEPNQPGDVVPRKFLDLFGGQRLTDEQAKQSGRLQLAQWLTARENPLTARVMVNRIWQYHFGSGLVKTPSDFGSRGQPPTHPELLD